MYFSSLQLLQIVWNMCFLYGEASKPSGESLTRYDTYTTYSHKHSSTGRGGHTNLYYIIQLSCDCFFYFLFSFCLISQIIKKSCIEILAAEPSSVCAGGKRCEEQEFPLLVPVLYISEKAPLLLPNYQEIVLNRSYP